MGKNIFVRIFVLDFVVTEKPLHNMLKQYRSFSWSEYVEKDFVGIKKSIIFAPVFVVNQLSSYMQYPKYLEYKDIDEDNK
jgi:hypothetical protein